MSQKLASGVPPTDIRSLTGLRGIAALLVVVFHYSMGMTGPGLLGNMLRHGYLCVDLFLVLSGYVMAMVYGKTFSRGLQAETYFTFLRRRLARIYPLYLMMTLVRAAMYMGHIAGQPVANLPRMMLTNVLMIQSWGLGDSIVGPAWSISCEWAAYLLFPFLITICLYRSTRLAIAAACVCMAGVVLVAYLPTSLLGEDPMDRFGPLNVFSGSTPAPVLRCMVEFVLGLLTYRVSRSMAGQAVASHGWCSLAVFAVLLVALAFPGSDVFIVALFPALILSLGADRGVVAGVLGSRVMYRLGVWSYAIYLVHPRTGALIQIVPKLLHGMAPLHATYIGIGAAIAATVGSAALAHSYIEVPGRDLFAHASFRLPGLATARLQLRSAMARSIAAFRVAEPQIG